MKQTRLKHVADVTLGKMPQSAPNSFEDELHPYLTASSITESGNIRAELPSMYFSPHERRSFSLHRGDIIVVEGGSIGRASFLARDLPDVYMQKSVMRVRPKRGISGKYLFYAIEERRGSGYFEAVTNIATIRHLPAVTLADTPLFVPKHDSQFKIADYLDHEIAEIDALIADLTRLRELLEARATGAIRENFERRTKIVSRRVLRTTLGRVSSIRAPLVDPRSEQFKSMPLIAPNHIERTSGLLGEHESAEAQGAESAKYLAIPGEVLYSKIRPHLAKATIATEACLCSADIYPLLADSRWITPEYLLEYILSSDFTHYAVTVSERVAMPKLNRDTLFSAPILVPGLELQSEIVNFARTERKKAREARGAILAAIALAKERRAALITAAVSGKIDVTAKHRPAAEQLEDDIKELS